MEKGRRGRIGAHAHEWKKNDMKGGEERKRGYMMFYNEYGDLWEVELGCYM